MWRFSLFGIPVGVEWFFWIATVLLGGGFTARTSADWTFVAIWVGVVFVSILWHEFGHALAGRYYGAHPAIKLHGFGGLTILPGTRFTRKQSILVTAAGPAAGLVLGLLILGISYGIDPKTILPRAAIYFGLQVNFFWTAINLLPIQPLDGGQILREVLGPRRRRAAAFIGGTLAVILGVWFILNDRVFLGFFLGMLAYHNFQQQPTEGGVIVDER